MNVPESVPASWNDRGGCRSGSTAPRLDPAGAYDFGKPLVAMRLEKLGREGRLATGVPEDRATTPPESDPCPSSFYQCPANSAGGYDGKGGDHAAWLPGIHG